MNYAREPSYACQPVGLNLVEGGGFEPPKLSRQIYSLIPLATREPLPHDLPRVKIPGSLTQGRHFIGIGMLVQSFDRVFPGGSEPHFLLINQAILRLRPDLNLAV